MINYDAMDDKFSFVPHHMRDGFKLWIENGIPPGSFASAVLSNDLKGALGKADHVNRNHLYTIVSWLYNFSPSSCWGSEENFANWKGMGEQCSP